jgi:hypothetical protein
MEQGALVSLYQVQAPLALRKHTRLDQRDHGGNALHIGLLEVTKQRLREGELAGMSLPEINERRRVHTDDTVKGQVSF